MVYSSQFTNANQASILILTMKSTTAIRPTIYLNTSCRMSKVSHRNHKDLKAKSTNLIIYVKSNQIHEKVRVNFPICLSTTPWRCTGEWG